MNPQGNTPKCSGGKPMAGVMNSLIKIGQWVRDHEHKPPNVNNDQESKFIPAARIQGRRSSMNSSGGIVLIGDATLQWQPTPEPTSMTTQPVLIAPKPLLVSTMPTTFWQTGLGAGAVAQLPLIQSYQGNNYQPIAPSTSQFSVGINVESGHGHEGRPCGFATVTNGNANNMRGDVSFGTGSLSAVPTSGGEPLERGRPLARQGRGKSTDNPQLQECKLLRVPTYKPRSQSQPPPPLVTEMEDQRALKQLRRKEKNRESAKRSREKKRELDEERVQVIKTMTSENKYLKRLLKQYFYRCYRSEAVLQSLGKVMTKNDILLDYDSETEEMTVSELKAYRKKLKKRIFQTYLE